MQGDFLEKMTTAPAPPDVIFFDMFSSKTDADQWTLSAFRKIFTACEERAVELFTYTCSTPARASLLVAGFHLAKGRATVDKVDTTIALTPAAASIATQHGHEFLGAEWFGKWSRSSAKFPADVPPEEHASFEQAIRTHPQFKGL